MSDKKYKTGGFPYGPPMMCPKCEMKLQSKYRGQFVMCKCKNQAFVDQTTEYNRNGAMTRDGFPIPYKEEQDETK